MNTRAVPTRTTERSWWQKSDDPARHHIAPLPHDKVNAGVIRLRVAARRDHVPGLRRRRSPRLRTHVDSVLSALRRHPLAASLLVHGAMLALLGQSVSRGPPKSESIDLVATTAVVDELTLDELDLTVQDVEIQQEQWVATPSLEAPALSVEIAGAFGGGDFEPLADRSELLGMLGITSGELGSGLGERGSGMGQGGRGKYQRPFELLVETLRRDGLDLVIVFDSTSSMGAEIETVKTRILQIGKSLIDKIPDTRIGFVTYKDITDPPVAAGVPLTNDLDQLLQFLSQVQPSGGGTDIPEAVQAGLELAVANSQFRPKARKVILLFGDAPPRPEQLAGSLSIAKHFRGRYRGKLSTVTCRMPQPLPAMAAIAKAGGGEAHVLYDHERILDELLVLVFGGRFRADVYRFFELGSSG